MTRKNSSCSLGATSRQVRWDSGKPWSRMTAGFAGSPATATLRVTPVESGTRRICVKAKSFPSPLMGEGREGVSISSATPYDEHDPTPNPSPSRGGELRVTDRQRHFRQRDIFLIVTR